MGRILAEISSLTPWHALARETRGRTSVGSAKMDIEQSARFLHAVLEGNGAADNPVASLSPGQAFLGASEDMRTFYMEAATAKPGPAASREVADWFWGETAAGELLLALRPICLNSAEPGIRRAAAKQLVPRSQMHRLG